MALDLAPLRPRIAELCVSHRVRQLDVFGSAVRPDFDAVRSDVDFLVEFADTEPQGAADRYFGLRAGLQRVVGRPVDLVVRAAIRNPYVLQAIERERRNVFAA